MNESTATTPAQRKRRLLSTDPRLIERLGNPFQPLEPECAVVQLDQPLTPAHWQQAGELVAQRPDVLLYVYGRASRDLDFLRYFHSLRRLHVALYELQDIAGLSQVAKGLEELTFGRTRRTFSLHFLRSMSHLGSLFLVHHKKDLAVLSTLTRLTKLGLSGITLPDLSLLLPLAQLQNLSIFLGGTTNLALLPQLAVLQELRLMRITKLSDLGVLGDLLGLTKLRLDWLRNVTALPSLARLVRLEDVALDTMKGLTDLSPVVGAPALRKLSITGMPQLTADSFRCLLGHPHLAELWVHTGQRRVNEEVKRMFAGIAC